MDLIFELPNRIPADAKRPTAQAIYELLKTAILSGELAAGCRLPPTRAAGEQFGLSRNTMVSIYERLAAEDLIEARRGSGTFVAPLADLARPSDNHADKSSPPAWFAESVARNSRYWPNRSPPSQISDEFELRPGCVDPRLFPFDKFRRSMAKALRQMERSSSIYEQLEQSQGDYRLRHSIADHVTLMRALVCDPEDILVTSGTQQTLDILARTLVETNQTVVAIEEPFFGPLIEPFIAAGARLRRIPVDDEGMVVEAIPDDVKIVCVAPSNQFPLGVAMSAQRRQQLHAFARERNVLIIEDDYGGELRTSGEPLKTLYSHDPSIVFYVGTFSLSMFPSFRLGFMIPPKWALGPLTRAKSHGDWQSSSVVQAAAASFIKDGYLSAHVAKMRTIYKDRKSVLLDAIQTNFGGNLRPFHSTYGIHFTAIGNPAIDWVAVSSRAETCGILVRPLARYCSGPPQPGLVFGIGMEGEQRLRLAIDRLAALT